MAGCHTLAPAISVDASQSSRESAERVPLVGKFLLCAALMQFLLLWR